MGVAVLQKPVFTNTCGGLIWPSSNKNFASYQFCATSFRKSDHSIPFSLPTMGIRESCPLLIMDITVTKLTKSLPHQKTWRQIYVFSKNNNNSKIAKNISSLTYSCRNLPLTQLIGGRSFTLQLWFSVMTSEIRPSKLSHKRQYSSHLALSV